MPRRRHLPRDHAAHVVLERDVVDGADAAAEAPQLDGAAVLAGADDDRVAAAEAQHLAAATLDAVAADERDPAAGERLRGHPAVDRNGRGAVDLQARAGIGADGDGRGLAQQHADGLALAVGQLRAPVIVGQDLGRRGALTGHALGAALGQAHAVAPPSPRQCDQRGGGRSRRGAEHHGQGGQNLAQGHTLPDDRDRPTRGRGRCPFSHAVPKRTRMACSARGLANCGTGRACPVRATRRATEGGDVGRSPWFAVRVGRAWRRRMSDFARGAKSDTDGVFRAGFGRLRHGSCVCGAPPAGAFRPDRQPTIATGVPR